jgi:hypothetical protein
MRVHIVDTFRRLSREDVAWVERVVLAEAA